MPNDHLLEKSSGNKRIENSEKKGSKTVNVESSNLYFAGFTYISNGTVWNVILEVIFRCREMKVHIAMRCSAPSESIALLFLFQITNFNSSFLLLKIQQCVLINLMSFSSQKFISAVSDECSLCSLSLSVVERFSSLSLCNQDCGGFSWLCWKLNKQKMMLKIHLRLPLAFQDILNNLNFIAETPTEICSTWLCSQLQT